MVCLRVGIAVDSAVKQPTLAQLVIQAGHQLACQLVLNQTSQGLPGDNLDAWLVDVDETFNDDQQLLEQIFNHSHLPIIVNDSGDYPPGSTEHCASLKRTSERLARLNSDVQLQALRPARQLWILAASTGGPAAVKRFLTCLPDKLGLAFIYAQHIDQRQMASLGRMMASASKYPVQLAHTGMVLAADRLVLVSAAEQVSILENRTLAQVAGRGWKGSYAPSIDQLVANAARIYRQDCGLIIFTGMGDDGAYACRLVKQLGGTAWVQAPADCTIDSMPSAALATGCIALSGTPETLAQALSQRYAA